MRTTWCKSRTVLAALSLLCLVSCASSIPRGFQAFVGSPALEGSHTGLAARSLHDNGPLYGVNATRYFVPASNMKLFTTAAALLLLGPEFRFTTRIYTDGSVNNGVLSGNILIKGVGDPTLSPRFHEGGASRIFLDWAESLRSQGIMHVAGNIVGDGSLFDGQHLGTGWDPDDEIHCYSARISALSLDDNCTSVIVLPGKEQGERASVSADVAEGPLLFTNQAVTTAAGDGKPLRFYRGPGQNDLTVTGTVAVGAPEQRFFVSVQNPALLAAEFFRHTLQAKGITVSGSAIDHGSSAPPLPYDSMVVLASYTSPPLSVMLREINKSSRNLYAELIFRTMGAARGKDGSAQEAAAVVKNAVARMGIADNAVIIYDGSGLSRLNLSTPQAIVGLLEYMYRHEHFSYFWDSLSVAGVDGTLARRLKNTAGEGRIIAKTGRMTHVFSLAGYAKGRKGGLLAFSLMTNNYTGSVEEMKSLQDRLCGELLNLAD